MPCPPLAIYDEVSTALAVVAPTFLGRRHLPQQDAPRRYVWVFASEESAGAARIGGNARSLHNDAWSVEVHCWGASFEEAYRLRQALVTVLRRHVQGANYRLGRTAILSGEQYTACGDVMVVGLTLMTPLAAARIEELVDDVRPTVVAKKVAIDTIHAFENPSPARGDGLLEPFEE